MSRLLKKRRTALPESAEDIITRYRGTAALLRRVYHDQEIRHCVVAISTAIKKSVFQGNENVALELAAVLHMTEPLEERTVQDRAGALIIIVYAYYVLHDRAEALRIAREANTRFPGDEQLQHIIQLLS